MNDPEHALPTVPRIPYPYLVVAVLVLGGLDAVTGHEFEFSDFYLFPVAAAAWWFGRRSGFFLSGLASLTEIAADFWDGRIRSHPALLAWDLVAEFALFMVVCELLVRLKASRDREREMARTDSLTGLANRRSFAEAALREIERLKRYRHPFTVALMDLDHFKEMNDTQGHEVGDRILKVVAEILKKRVRSTDPPARLGGDEFAVLFPETNEKKARQMIPDLHRRLCGAMKEQHWPVTFSIGAVTYRRPPKDVEEMLSLPDKLMYRVKESGRDGIAYGRH
jgi:diguanylate cyclase (GGDEF)-like protein